MAKIIHCFYLVLIIVGLWIPCQAHFGVKEAQPPISYTRDALLALRSAGLSPVVDLPECVRLQPTRARPRKRGRRGGVRQRLLRRGNRPPLPSMILCNARSLRAKIDELRINTKACFEYRTASLLAITETWLHRDIQNSLVDIEGFSLIRADRTEESGKCRGGGMAVYVSNNWCKQHTVRESFCSPDVELLHLHFRPFHLPREFGSVSVCVVYVPPSGNAARAATRIADCVHNELQRSPGAPVFIMGDFNHCKLELALPGFEQYVRCSTRDNRTLDKCYGNINNAYIAKPKPPLANSDHNVIHLIPTYKTMLKRSKPQVKTVTLWTEEGIESLKGCFLCTDWDVFHDADINVTTDTITDYINYCVDSVLHKKQVVVYANNKPYITKDIKNCINRKKAAFRNKDKLELKVVQRELNQLLRQARNRQRDIIETQFVNMNSRKLWDAMKSAANMRPSKVDISTSDDHSKANELNNFFLRFETHDFKNECMLVLSSLNNEANVHKVDRLKIQTLFQKVCTRKAMGPDGISARLLKTCAEELIPACCPIFQRSLDSHTVPALWKKAAITPVPKKPCPTENNDFRPIALTSIVMKCFEKYMVSLLKTEVNPKLDPWQFAYKHHRSTNDAVSSITHLVLKHLEDPKAYARLLFIDFSSAFNTIQPFLLLETLKNMGVSSFIIKWYYSFLTNRMQYVRVHNATSQTKCISTGAPQGCVSSPVLFTIYTNECVSTHPHNYIVKFSDDTAILGLLHRDQDTESYHSEIKQFVDWCDAHHLVVNVRKTQEMIFDPRVVSNTNPVRIHNTPICQVSSYKYLGVFMDSSLTWQVHIESLCTKLQQRMYFLRRLRLYGVNNRLLFLFFQMILESVIQYGMQTWYGNLTVQLKAKLGRLVKTALRIVGHQDQGYMQSLYEKSVLREALKILEDPTHILHQEFTLLPSGKRFRTLNCRLNKYKNSFVPTAIRMLNDR